jgi:hypothetical protein
MAGRENLYILAFLHPTKIRHQTFIEEDGVVPTPDLLRLEERHQQQRRP